MHHTFADMFHDWMLTYTPAKRYNVTVLVKSAATNFSHAKQKRLALDYDSDRESTLKLVIFSVVHAIIHSLSL